MKVIIPVINNREKKNNLAEGFHNTEFACIYNSTDGSFEWMQTDEITSRPGNLSIELKRQGIYTVISNQISLMALGLFTESGLKVYKAESNSVSENIKLLENQSLKPLTVHSVIEMNCHGSCSSCNTSCS